MMLDNIKVSTPEKSLLAVTIKSKDTDGKKSAFSRRSLSLQHQQESEKKLNRNQSQLTQEFLQNYTSLLRVNSKVDDLFHLKSKYKIGKLDTGTLKGTSEVDQIIQKEKRSRNRSTNQTAEKPFLKEMNISELKGKQRAGSIFQIAHTSREQQILAA